MGLFSSSSSKSNTTNNNTDRRVVADGGAIGISGDGVNVNVLDGGAIARTFDSFDLVSKAQADGIDSLLGAVTSIFKTNNETISAQAAQVNQSVLEAYRTASTDKAGTIDNKTLIVLAVAGAIAVYFMTRK